MHEMNFTRVQTFAKFADVHNWEFNMLIDAYYHSWVHFRETFLSRWESLLPSDSDWSIFTANAFICCVWFNRKVQKVLREHRFWPRRKETKGKGSCLGLLSHAHWWMPHELPETSLTFIHCNKCACSAQLDFEGFSEDCFFFKYVCIVINVTVCYFY